MKITPYRIFRFIIRRLIRLFYVGELSYLMEIDLEAPMPEISLDSELEWRLAGMDDLPLFKELLPKYRVKKIENRFSNGEHCLLALYKEVIVHYCWICWEDNYYVSELEFEISVLPDKAYIYDAFTCPGYRDRGIYSQVLQECGRRMSAIGRRGIMLYADRKNSAAVQAALRSGFSIQGRIEGKR
jgi:predicted GNAT family acetyltransferase